MVKNRLHCRFGLWVRKVPWRRVGSPPQYSWFSGGSAGADDADGKPRIPLTVTGKVRLLSSLPHLLHSFKSPTGMGATCLWFRQPQLQKYGVLVPPDYGEGRKAHLGRNQKWKFQLAVAQQGKSEKGGGEWLWPLSAGKSQGGDTAGQGTDDALSGGPVPAQAGAEGETYSLRLEPITWDRRGITQWST